MLVHVRNRFLRVNSVEERNEGKTETGRGCLYHKDEGNGNGKDEHKHNTITSTNINTNTIKTKIKAKDKHNTNTKITNDRHGIQNTNTKSTFKTRMTAGERCR